MGIHGPRMSCSTLFLLLLLSLPPIVKVENLRYRGPGWKLFQRLGKGSRSSQQRKMQRMRENWSLGDLGEECQGVFDLYFILDKSGSVGKNWIHIYEFMEEMVKKFQNPKLRMSFITYSTDAEVVMPLTSDREEIRNGLLKLQNVVASGHTHMQKGFKKANEQIRKATSGGNNVNSVIIALSNGVLMTDSFKETVGEADKARQMGAIVYTVGVHMYNKWQMVDIADSEKQSFGIDSGFTALQDIIDALVHKSCTEITSVQPSKVCMKEPYQVNISGHGFNNTKDLNQVICRFMFRDSRVVDESTIDLNEHSITCPGPKIQQAGEEVSLEVSLNNGISFIGNKFTITSTSCENTKSQGNGDKSRAMSGEPEKDLAPDRDIEEEFVEDTEDSILSSWNLLLILPVLVVALLLLCCCFWFCCRKSKEPPSTPQNEEEPQEENQENARPPSTSSAGVSSPPAANSPPSASSPAGLGPTVIVACCGCANRQAQGNVDMCCGYLYPNCHQVPVMLCHPKHQGRCTNYSVMNPSCSHAPGNPKFCLHSNKDCFHLTQPQCVSGATLQPNGEYVNIPQAPCFQPSGECFPATCYTLNYSEAPGPPRGTKSFSRMLPLLPPHARQSVESLGRTHPSHPTSKRPKF